MLQSNRYSLCFQPDETTIEIVRQMKLQLSEYIGWYNSKNALAHITISKFQTDEIGIQKITTLVRQQCSTFVPTPVVFNSYGHYPNGAFFLAVAPENQIPLKAYAKKVCSKIALPNIYKSNEPHLSIARKLDSDKLQKALTYFEQPHLSFICNQVALRRFNPQRGQYDIIDIFPFLGLPSMEVEQLSLF
ncbi:MAG: 2'-5' RNA ligase family protein [Flavobacteriaceae bacterium]|jgi:2'-5' RNA ligase|nr:2'-5' RNA ligase family protein [Flavobacteriaceae bacterium]